MRLGCAPVQTRFSLLKKSAASLSLFFIPVFSSEAGVSEEVKADLSAVTR